MFNSVFCLLEGTIDEEQAHVQRFSWDFGSQHRVRDNILLSGKESFKNITLALLGTATNKHCHITTDSRTIGSRGASIIPSLLKGPPGHCNFVQESRGGRA